MAGLANGAAIVTTTGKLTEALWAETGAVALADAGDGAGMLALALGLLDNPSQQEKLRERAKRLYKERFDVAHTVFLLSRCVPSRCIAFNANCDN
jgi:hypothetical protein